MEKSKKIVSIILVICALSALCAVCAVSVSADTVDTSHVYYLNDFYSSSDVFELGRFDTDFSYMYQRSPLRPTSGGYCLSNCLFKLPLTSSPSNVLFSCSLTWTVHNDRNAAVVAGDVASYFQSTFKPVFAIRDLTVIPSYTSVQVLTSLYTSPSSSFSYDPTTKVFSVTAYYFADLSTLDIPSNYYDKFYIGFQVKSLDGFFTSSNNYAPVVSLISSLVSSDFAVDITPPEPDPDPSDPSSGSSEGALLDGFTWAQNIGYYASFSPLLNSSTLEPSYLGVTRMSRLPYDQITDSKFQAPSSSNGCALIMGQKTDYDDILVSGTVGYGVCAMLVTSPLFKLDPSTLGVDYSAQVFFASGDDPSASGYTQVDASTLGLEEYTVRVWTIDYNEWSKIVMCRYYFVLDLGVSTPSFPTDTISVQFKSTSVHTHEWFWTPFDFRFQYALRGSESDPLPDSVTNYNPATGSPTSTGGYNTSGSTVTSELNEEYNWSQDLFKSVDTVVTPIFEQLDGMYNNNISLAGLDTLYTALSYSGTGGTITLPSATIPFGDTTLHLWDQQTIPFNEYITQIPQVYKVIISFLLIGGGFFACSAIFYKFFKQVFFGDVSNERF